MQPLSERTRLSFPRYRIEERTPDMAAIIVGFAEPRSSPRRCSPAVPHN